MSNVRCWKCRAYVISKYWGVCWGSDFSVDCSYNGRVSLELDTFSVAAINQVVKVVKRHVCVQWDRAFIRSSKELEFQNRPVMLACWIPPRTWRREVDGSKRHVRPVLPCPSSVAVIVGCLCCNPEIDLLGGDPPSDDLLGNVVYVNVFSLCGSPILNTTVVPGICQTLCAASAVKRPPIVGVPRCVRVSLRGAPAIIRDSISVDRASLAEQVDSSDHRIPEVRREPQW
jgi:hypothetical protein